MNIVDLVYDNEPDWMKIVDNDINIIFTYVTLINVSYVSKIIVY